MRFNLKIFHLIFYLCFIENLTGCITKPFKPCTAGGQPAREGNVPFQGIKRCYQEMNKEGMLVNHGKYREWYNNDKIALEGEYQMGKKSGRWIEYDQKGNKISDKYYQDGKEVSRP